MKKQGKKRIYRDKHGREYQKQRYFIGGKMKFRRVYLVDGMPAEEFYEKNASVIELVIDGNYHLLDKKNEFDTCQDGWILPEKGDDGDLPF